MNVIENIKHVILGLALVISFSLVGAENPESLEMDVVPEDPQISDNVFVEVYDEAGNPVENVEIVSKNNLIGVTDDDGSITFTPSASQEYVLTAEKDGLWTQHSFAVEGATVDAEAENSVDQPVTGQFTEEPSNMYVLGFIFGALVGFVLIIQYTGRFDFREKFLN